MAVSIDLNEDITVEMTFEGENLIIAQGEWRLVVREVTESTYLKIRRNLEERPSEMFACMLFLRIGIKNEIDTYGESKIFPCVEVSEYLDYEYERVEINYQKNNMYLILENESVKITDSGYIERCENCDKKQLFIQNKDKPFNMKEIKCIVCGYNKDSGIPVVT